MEIAELEVPPAETVQEIDLESLYRRAFPSVARFVSARKGSFDQASDIFHDAVIIYFERSRESSFCLRTTPDAYLLGIVKHLWLRTHNDDRQLTPLPDDCEIPDDFVPTIDTHRLMLFLERTGKKCLDLLRAFYFDNKNLTELARTRHYAGEHSASVQKYKCIEKLRTLIQQQSATYEDFTT